jgi:iron complex transport system substrate-binding protein
MAARPQKLIVLVALLACGADGRAKALPHATAALPREAAADGPPYKRIISLVPALTEMLFAIGAGPQVIAVSSFDDDPPEVLTLPRVGALLDPDVERILAMRPDLVLIYGSQEELEKQLTAGGIRAFPYRHGGLADITPAIRTLGELTGRQTEAARLVAQIESGLAAVRARVANRGQPKTLLVMGREPESTRHLNVSGGIGFLHDVVGLAGGANVFGDIKRQSVKVSTEMLIVRAPEVVLDLHYSRALQPREVEKERSAWNVTPSVPAVKNKRVHVLVGDHLVVPGPRIVQAAEEFARAIHPEAFK